MNKVIQLSDYARPGPKETEDRQIRVETLGALITTNVGVSKLFTNPQFVRWLAQATKIKSAGPYETHREADGNCGHV